MASEHILRIPRSDSQGDFVLVSTSSNGSSPLDLKLLATEGDSPYVTTIKRSRILKLRDKRSQLSDEQWENILLSSLLDRRVQKPEAASVEKLEMIGTIAGDVLAIQFRNNISGITQKLGEILLKQDETQEIDAINWCGTAIKRSARLEAEVQDLAVKYNEQSKTIEKLNKQLEELIQAKTSHEDSLLAKFRELLNAKKIRIRDQQRLLAGARVNLEHSTKVGNARMTSKAHRPTTSRSGKRKAKSPATASQSSEDESFERKGPRPKEESDGSEQLNTPEASDQDLTEDESDDDLDSAPRKNTVTDWSKGNEDGSARGANTQIGTLPPPRNLPFGKPEVGERREHVQVPAQNNSTLNQEAGNVDEETDDDDEL